MVILKAECLDTAFPASWLTLALSSLNPVYSLMVFLQLQLLTIMNSMEQNPWEA